MEGITAEVVEIARELELEVEPEDGTELQSHEETWMDMELVLRDEERKCFFFLGWNVPLVKML